MNTASQDKEFVRAKQTVFRLFRFRPRSEKEIAERLRKKEIPEDTIKKTILYLKRSELIDDRMFAKGWISSRLKKPFGLSRIRFELKQKGIKDEILSEEMENAVQDYSEIDAVLDLAQRRLRKYGHLEKIKAKQRLYNYLVRRGFKIGTIYKAIKELF